MRNLILWSQDSFVIFEMYIVQKLYTTHTLTANFHAVSRTYWVQAIIFSYWQTASASGLCVSARCMCFRTRMRFNIMQGAANEFTYFASVPSWHSFTVSWHSFTVSTLMLLFPLCCTPKNAQCQQQQFFCNKPKNNSYNKNFLLTYKCIGK